MPTEGRRHGSDERWTIYHTNDGLIAEGPNFDGPVIEVEPASRIDELSAENERLREVAEPFAKPAVTSRGEARLRPEDDPLKVEVTMGAWWKLLIAVGHMDAEYLRGLPEKARPSEEFLAALHPTEETEGETG